MYNIYIFIEYSHIYYYILVWGYGSVGQPKASNPEFPGSTPGGSCFSLVLIKNLINENKNTS